MQQVEAPVLFITFNRPESTRVVFEAIRQAKPKKLYISSDGPRPKKYEDDQSKISEVRKLAGEVDWDCAVKTRFLEENLGCGPGVSSAITWAFQEEEKLIIIEDDCIPSLSFFSFCNELLNRYADNERIMHISGTRWNEEYPIHDCDYFFTKYDHIWGWATWKRAWDLYDFKVTDYPLFKEKKILNIALNNSASIIRNWTAILDDIYQRKVKHTWDYQWQYCIFKYNGLCINTVKNLVTNIGTEGVHDSKETYMHNRTRFETKGQLKAPAFLYPEYGWEEYHAKHFFLKGSGSLKLLYYYLSAKIPYLNRLHPKLSALKRRFTGYQHA